MDAYAAAYTSNDQGWVEACAQIVANMFGSNAEQAKDLAYRLYTIAEQKNWADEAYAYNSLVVAWPDIQSRAAALKAVEPKQMTLFDYDTKDKYGRRLRFAEEKLIENWIPLKELSASAIRDKARKGHPGNLHLWWNRSPIDSSTAVLFSALVDEDDAEASELITEIANNHSGAVRSAREYVKANIWMKDLW